MAGNNTLEITPAENKGIYTPLSLHTSESVKLPQTTKVKTFFAFTLWDLTNWFQALGNHEFDEGLPTLQNFISNVTEGDGKFNVLSSNIDNSNEQGLTGFLPWVIKEVGGKKIGIIGYTTRDTVTLTAPGKRYVCLDDS